MKFKSIFIANLAEIAKPLAELMGKARQEEEIFEDHALCDRFLFSDTDKRILITPFLLDQNFVKDVCQTLNYHTFLNLAPQEVGDSLCEAIIRDKKLLTQISQVIKSNPGINFVAYAATPEFLKLVDKLRQEGLTFRTPEIPQPEAQWTSAFFDSKSGFRQSVPYLGPEFAAMPEGFICHNFSEIFGWTSYFLEKSDGCVLKTNRGLAGAGVKIIRKKDLSKINLSNYLREIIESELYWQREPVVVEQLVEIEPSIAGGNPSVEFQVTDQKVIPLYVCGMRVTAEGVFRGVEIGKGAVPQKLVQLLFAQGKLWARFLQKIGYRGFFDIDYVYDKKGKIYPIESNIRRTGGTHVYEMTKRLLGKGYLDKYYVVANNIISAPRFAQKDYLSVKKALAHLFYPLKGQKEGVILTDMTLLAKGSLGYVIIGKDKKRVAKIEEDFLKLLA